MLLCQTNKSAWVMNMNSRAESENVETADLPTFSRILIKRRHELRRMCFMTAVKNKILGWRSGSSFNFRLNLCILILFSTYLQRVSQIISFEKLKFFCLLVLRNAWNWNMGKSHFQTWYFFLFVCVPGFRYSR